MRLYIIILLMALSRIKGVYDFHLQTFVDNINYKILVLYIRWKTYKHISLCSI